MSRHSGTARFVQCCVPLDAFSQTMMDGGLKPVALPEGIFATLRVL